MRYKGSNARAVRSINGDRWDIDAARETTRSRFFNRRRQTCFLPLLVEALEARLVLSGYLPPSVFDYLPSSHLSPPMTGAPADIALSFLQHHAWEFGLSAADLENPFITDEYTDSDTGLTHI